MKHAIWILIIAGITLTRASENPRDPMFTSGATQFMSFNEQTHTIYTYATLTDEQAVIWLHGKKALILHSDGHVTADSASKPDEIAKVVLAVLATVRASVQDCYPRTDTLYDAQSLESLPVERNETPMRGNL